MKLTGKAIKEKVMAGEKFNVVIIDKDTDCSINMGFGFIPSSAFVEELDEYGVVMSDDIISLKEAINKVSNHSDRNFYEVRLEEIDAIETNEEILAIWA